MSPIFLAHVAVFAAAAVACVAAVPRALRIRDAETREGFVALLIAVTLWAGGYVGYLVAPGAAAKVAFYIVGFVFALLAVGTWLYFCAAYTGRSPRRAPYRQAAIGVFAATALLKVTNPLHGLYFTTAWRTEPFPHLAIQHGPLYWAVLGLSYAIIAVGFFMLLEQFYYTGTDSRPLIGLVALTGIPTVATVFGASSPRLLPLMYEPPGVALFALGTLFVYFRRFETIQFAAESDAAAIFVDRAGRVRDFNRAARDLFPELRDAVGDPLEAVLPNLAADGDEDGLVRVGEGEAQRFYRVSRNAFTSGGAMGGELLAIDDVTDRETYRIRLEERTEQLEALNRVVRHDIRNDMAVVHGWAETLQDHVDDDGRDALERVLRKSRHVIELTEIARDFVDSLAADVAPETKPVALGELLDGEIRAARDSFPEATFVVDGDLPSVTVSANELLTSVFRNLLNNAVQHNDTEAPTVTVEVETTADRVRVTVADDGPGIPEEVRPNIFGKGQKGIDSSGTGIGLYLVSILTAQFGGDVRVEDNEPRGAVFVVELPRADGDPPQATTRSPP
jgi:signal transduction histidine kinase